MTILITKSREFEKKCIFLLRFCFSTTKTNTFSCAQNEMERERKKNHTEKYNKT